MVHGGTAPKDTLRAASRVSHIRQTREGGLAGELACLRHSSLGCTPFCVTLQVDEDKAGPAFSHQREGNDGPGSSLGGPSLELAATVQDSE